MTQAMSPAKTEASSRGMRIAFFGGSFDPPHIGHVAVANAALKTLALDQVLFAPVGLQPLKPAGSSASFEDRVAMIRLAIAAHPAFKLSLLDAPAPSRAGPNYTFDTMTALRTQLAPGAQLFLLLGADSFCTLRHWHRAAELLFLASLIVAARPGETLNDLPACLPAGIALAPIAPERYALTNAEGQQSILTVLPDLNYDISATQLRNQVNGQSDQPALLDPAVLNYIRRHHLYA